MHILITGVAGFIGSNMAAKCLRKGYAVTGIDNFSPYYDVDIKKANVADLQSAGLDFIQADLAEQHNYSSFPSGIDYIFHFAAQPGISSAVSFNEYERNNVLATQLLVDFAASLKKLKIFVHISTSSVYGLDATKDETNIPEPASLYGVTKLAAEQLVLSASRQNKLNACSLRLYSVYGPGERPDKLYTKLIDAVINDRKFPLYEGSLLHKRSFTYVDDITDGIIAVISREEICNTQIINLGSDLQYTTAEGIKIVEDILGKKVAYDVQPARKGDQQSTLAKIDKAIKLLNYFPTVNLDEGLKKQVEWFQQRKKP